MTDQPISNTELPHNAEPQQKVPFYRNPWLNFIVVALGLFVDPLILIWSLVMMWTGPYYVVRLKRPFKLMGIILKTILSACFVGLIVFTYLPALARLNVAGCSNDEAIKLVKQLAKRNTIAAVSYDNVQVTAIRTIGEGRPNGGVTCAAEMTDITLGNGMRQSAGIIYTVDPTDARDKIVVNLRFDNR